MYSFTGSVASQLSHFAFFLGEVKVGESVNLCSEYPFSATGKNQLRINCKPGSSLHSEVQLMSRYNKGLDIAELEVHTLGNLDFH